MSEGGSGFPFGGGPEDLLRGRRESAEQQAESVQEAQREQLATLTLNAAAERTAAALAQIPGRGAVGRGGAAEAGAGRGRRAGRRHARRDARALPRRRGARVRRAPGLHARALDRLAAGERAGGDVRRGLLDLAVRGLRAAVRV